MSSKLKVNNIIPSTGTQIGISTTGGGINLLTGTVVTGVITATSFSGSGANLTSLPTQVTIANNGNDRIITGGSGVNLNGEANLQFDGTNLFMPNELRHLGDPDTKMGFDTDTIKFETAGTERLRIQNDGTVYLRGSSSSDSHRLQVRVNDTDTEFRGSSSSGTNKGFAFYSSNTNGSEKVRIGSDGTVTLQAEDLVFGTTGKGIEFPNSVSVKQNVSNLYANLASGNNNIEFQSNGTSFVKFRGTNGNVEIVDGNLVLSTAGHGIDFSATGDGSGTDSSELLADYEEGTWTPVPSRYASPQGAINCSMSTQLGRYRKIGKLVQVEFYLSISSVTSQGGNLTYIAGLPYAPVSAYMGSGNLFYNSGLQHDNVSDATFFVAPHTELSSVLYFHPELQASHGLSTKNWQAGHVTGSCTYQTTA